MSTNSLKRTMEGSEGKRLHQCYQTPVGCLSSISISMLHTVAPTLACCCSPVQAKFTER